MSNFTRLVVKKPFKRRSKSLWEIILKLIRRRKVPKSEGSNISIELIFLIIIVIYRLNRLL